MGYLMHWNDDTQQFEHKHPKRELTVYTPPKRTSEPTYTPQEYTLVFPDGYTREEYLRESGELAEESSGEKWYIDLTTVLI